MEDKLIRCLALIGNGLSKDLFAFSVQPFLDEAQAMIEKGKLLLEGSRVRPVSPSLFDGVHPTQEDVEFFLTRLYVVLQYGVEQKKVGKIDMEMLKKHGLDICAVFQKAMDIVPMNAILRENLLEIMVDFYDMTEANFEEMAVAGEQLLKLQQERDADAWTLADTCMKLSNAYLGSFPSNPNWCELSHYYLDQSCEYAKIAEAENNKGGISNESNEPLGRLGSLRDLEGRRFERIWRMEAGKFQFDDQGSDRKA